MAVFDLAIVNGTVVSATGESLASVAVKDGRIAALVAPGEPLDAAETIDAAGRFLLPGVIDPHVHFRLQGWTFGDIAERESRSLIAGGVTTGLVFTEAPHRSYHDVLPERIEEANSRSYCDLGIHPMIQSLDHAREIGSIAERFGVASFKMYFAGGKRELYPETFAVDDGTMWSAFSAIARLGDPAMAMVHAENWEIAAVLQEELQREGRVDPAAWTESKPNFVEEEAILRAAFYAHRAGCPLYLVHVSTGEGPAIVRAARERGERLYGETCPHYLMIHKDHPKAILAKFNPAVKNPADNAALWSAIADGGIDCLGSDHIPIRWPDKSAMGFDNVWTARGGIPGSATILPLLLSEGVNAGRLNLSKVVGVTSTNPARLFGLAGRKGQITPGADADIVLVDLHRQVEVTPDKLQLDFTLFDGQTFTGWPTMTILRGQVVMDEGEIVGTPGQGQYLRRI